MKGKGEVQPNGGREAPIEPELYKLINSMFVYTAFLASGDRFCVATCPVPSDESRVLGLLKTLV